MNQKIQRVGLEIRKLDRTISRNLEIHVKEAGIDEVTLMHGWIIRYLYENREQEIYQKDIEKYFSIGRSTVTNIIQLMEKKGYIRRESVSCDARLKKVLLTQKGIQSHEAIEELIRQLEKEMTQGIEPEEFAIFLNVIHKIRENIEQPSGRGKETLDDQNIVERSKRV